MSKAKFNAARFKDLIQTKIKQKGLNNRSFINAHNFARSPFMKAMRGETRPSVATLNAWCKALDCTPEERAEIISAVYVDEESLVTYAA